MNDSYMTMNEIMAKIGLKHRPTFKENYFVPALVDGAIELLYPDHPKHPKQRYRLTEVAKEWKNLNMNI
ncbi:Fic family protein [Parabacteroides sp. ASD2025]|uniref:Fic family protein n=1 Tax=Parabacteroides sp. ASD2025 TaxID=3415987 RepID=UPI003CF80F09